MMKQKGSFWVLCDRSGWHCGCYEWINYFLYHFGKAQTQTFRGTVCVCVGDWGLGIVCLITGNKSGWHGTSELIKLPGNIHQISIRVLKLFQYISLPHRINVSNYNTYSLIKNLSLRLDIVWGSALIPRKAEAYQHFSVTTSQVKSRCFLHNRFIHQAAVARYI